MRRPFLLAAAAAAALAGCTVGPDYKRPEVKGAPAWSERAGGRPGEALSTVTTQAAPLARWWTQFHDPVLDDLVRRALADNLTVVQARARIREAAAQVAVARSAELPTVSGTTSALRYDGQSQTLNGFGAPGGAGGGGGAGGSGGVATTGANSALTAPNRLEAFSLGFNAAWELDLFGAVRQQVEAAKAQAESQVWSARDTEVSVVSQVAQAYLQLRLNQSRGRVLRADLARQQDLFRIIGDRFRTGFVTNLDVDQQRVQLANTQAQIPQVDAQVDAQAHAVAVLLGLAPDALYAELAPVKALPPVPPVIPAGLPSDLVRRRPDLRASERLLAAANAQVGAAVAAQFPTFSLTLLPTWSRVAVSDMFQPATRPLLSLAQGSVPIFQGGRLRAGVRSAQAAFDEAYAGYKQTVLQAFGEVEDDIVRYASDQKRWASLTGAHAAAVRGEVIARQQYAVGLQDYTGVLNAQASLNQIEDQLTQADAALATDVVALYKALGGGWDEADPAIGVGAPYGSEAADPPRSTPAQARAGL